MLDIESRDLEILKAILGRRVPDCEVRAYGSRINGVAHRGSDLDLAIVGPTRIDPFVLAELGSDLEESDLPFSVDFLDWNAAPDSFREAIARRFEIIAIDQPSI